jgi:LysW-gamma-L-lysine carboxypeptidase
MGDLAFLKEMLSIPSPSGQEEAISNHLVDNMTALGFRAHRDEVGNAIGMVGNPNAERTIVLLGHMDTVPGHIPVKRRNGCLYGRGAVDAKGPLAGFVLATARVAPKLENSRVLVIGSVEEETGGRGARHIARTIPAPDYTIIGEPSDWRGVTLGYKGMLSATYELVLPSSHSAGEFPGPAEKAVAFWNKIVAFSTEWNDGRSGHFDTLDPALRDLCTSSDGLYDSVQMTTLLRLPPALQVSDLKEKMAQWCNGGELTFAGFDPPFRAEKNTPLVRAMLRGIRAQGGRPLFKLKTGTSDMNVVGPAWGCPIVAYGAGDSALDHTPNEHVCVEEFRQGISVLSHALEVLDSP